MARASVDLLCALAHRRQGAVLTQLLQGAELVLHDNPGLAHLAGAFASKKKPRAKLKRLVA
jgi:hypothetical protein